MSKPKRYVRIGDVRTFPGAQPDKAQVLKMSEEVHEVYSAWEDYAENDLAQPYARARMLQECADVIQATVNLIAALGGDCDASLGSIVDFTGEMKKCEKRNRERGRYAG